MRPSGPSSTSPTTRLAPWTATTGASWRPGGEEEEGEEEEEEEEDGLQFNGLIGMLQRGEIDVAVADMSETADRSKVIHRFNFFSYRAGHLRCF